VARDPGHDAVQTVVDAAEPAAGDEPSGFPAVITNEQRAIFWGSPEEPDPHKRFDDQHYVHSNEQHHELYFPYITAIGGGYVGVASDQNYTLAAHARSEWIWLMDYDIVVVRMHKVVRAFVLEAQDALIYRSLWTKERKDEALQILASAYADDPDLDEIVKVFKKYRGMTEGYNTRVTSRAEKGKCAFWLTDAGSYEWIRELHRAGRIRALRGNLLEAVTLRGIGEAAEKLGTKIRAVYLSDAESFFPYKQNFRDNLASLPMDEKSVVLRTVSGEVFGVEAADYQWHYNLQSGLDFVGLLINDPPVTKVYGMVKQGKKTASEGVSLTGLAEKPAWVLPAPGDATSEEADGPAGQTEPVVAPATQTEPVEDDGTEPEPVALAPAPALASDCGAVPEDMVCVPEGTFIRGADDSDEDRTPASKVWLSTFWIERFEVTNDKFNACIKAGGCKKHESYKGFMGPRQPAVGITWFNAQNYCAWAGRRLPTEAEWEKAARGTDGDLYPWGNEPPTCERAHTRGCTPEVTLEVGSLPAGHYGIFDMAGNGYEWVQDWWSPCYDGCEKACGDSCTQKDPKGPCDGLGDKCPGFRPLKVLRGGSWFWPAAQTMASWRRHTKPESGEHRLSVRCVMTPSA
jgi:formylglycine-generating enzyme required for sulfatase activity